MNCDRIARPYRFLEYATFGPALWLTRIHFLNRLSDARRVLILGEGDGRFLKALLDKNPTVLVDCYDLSGKMIRLAQARTRSSRVQFFQQDILSAVLPDQTYDAVVANFIFDCFNEAELDRLIGRVVRASRSQAVWLVGDFAIPASGLSRIAARAVIGLLYLCFCAATGLETRRLTDQHALLDQHGLRHVDANRRLLGLLSSDLWVIP